MSLKGIGHGGQGFSSGNSGASVGSPPDGVLEGRVGRATDGLVMGVGIRGWSLMSSMYGVERSPPSIQDGDFG